jgi:hypothetical protein
LASRNLRPKSGLGTNWIISADIQPSKETAMADDYRLTEKKVGDLTQLILRDLEPNSDGDPPLAMASLALALVAMASIYGMPRSDIDELIELTYADVNNAKLRYYQ